MAATSQLIVLAQPVPVLADASPSPLASSPSSTGRSASPDTHQDSASSAATSPEPAPAPANVPASRVAIPSVRDADPPAPAPDELDDPADTGPPRGPVLRLAIPPEAELEAEDEESPPPAQDPALELCLDDDLTVVERAYLFAQSHSVFHRIYIARELPALLNDAPPVDAVTYIMPLLNPLATDTDPVKEALVTGIVDIMWWFFTHCDLVNGDPPEGEHDPPVISVQSFTPLLGSLLMNPHTTVGANARMVVVEILNRLHSADWARAKSSLLFGEQQRHLVERELVFEVVVGLAHLDNTEVQNEDASYSRQPPDVPISAFAEDPLPEEAPRIERPPLLSSPPVTESASTPEDSEDARLLNAPLLPQVVAFGGRVSPLVSTQNANDVPADLHNTVTDTSASDASPPLLPPSEHVVSDVPSRASPEIAPRSSKDGSSGLVDPSSTNGVPKQSILPSTSRVELDAVLERPETTIPSRDLTAHVAPDNPPGEHPGFSGKRASEEDLPVQHSVDTIPETRIPSPPSAVMKTHSTATNEIVDALLPHPSDPSSPDRIPSPDYSHSAAPSSESSATSSSSVSPSMPQFASLPPERDAPPHLSPSDPTQSFSRAAPPGHIALPPQSGFQSPYSLSEHAHASPPTNSDPVALAALFPGTPFPQEGEARDPMLQQGGGQATDLSRPPLPVHDPGISSDDAAIGRLTSMGLIATITANATAPLADEIRTVFVEEVSQLRDDPEFWVRREATFALGALAKVVPVEILVAHLLPLFQRWLHDSSWNVRQAAIFSLPNIITRLSPEARRVLALDVLPVYATDENDTVRSSVLEVLGEIIHAFKDDPDGPPAEILNLFLGDPAEWSSRSANRIWASNGFFSAISSQNPSGRLTPKPVKDPRNPWTDPSRELTCAFNFPAVALTLGASRWTELRDFYFHLSQSAVHKVRRTIAASIGEIAKIIGPDNAHHDLLSVWRDSVRSPETSAGDVRLKAIVALPAFLEALSEDDRQDVGDELEEIWVDCLLGWRERETLAASLYVIAPHLRSRISVVWALLLRALKDPVSAVREAAISVLPDVFSTTDSYLPTARRALGTLSDSKFFRDRHTYSACCLSICLNDRVGLAELGQPEMWQNLGKLSHDSIVDVRIGVARAVGAICEKYYQDSRLRPARVSSLVLNLNRDECDVVRSFVRFLTSSGSIAKRAATRAPSMFAAFHDPPPSTSPDEADVQPLLIDRNDDDVAHASEEPLLTPGTTYDLPSSMDWDVNASLLDETMSDEGNLSDESFGTLDMPWPDPFANPPSRPESPQWMPEPRIGL
ncbi:ARM repeat-containing protein [Exidia glandulosa HHB12029]|uniref:ARM repeat-containing protein n=1 Tax=Exidia glandulosa HHB12029 TaxID=1314781 RepID=A0A166A4B2_EXIGL|nr:ARM repeat-containing protein [Exidia glandulosa HHB12029]